MKEKLDGDKSKIYEIIKQKGEISEIELKRDNQNFNRKRFDRNGERIMKQKIRNIGIEATPPKKSCKDIKCPWHGVLSLRGRIFVGKIVSDKASKTVIVRWDYHHYFPKYERYERRHSKVAAYNPECIDAKKGDVVKISECRPLSKTKKFVVIEKVK